MTTEFPTPGGDSGGSGGSGGGDAGGGSGGAVESIVGAITRARRRLTRAAEKAMTGNTPSGAEGATRQVGTGARRRSGRAGVFDEPTGPGA